HLGLQPGEMPSNLGVLYVCHEDHGLLLVNFPSAAVPRLCPNWVNSGVGPSVDRSAVCNLRRIDDRKRVRAAVRASQCPSQSKCEGLHNGETQCVVAVGTGIGVEDLTQQLDARHLVSTGRNSAQSIRRVPIETLELSVVRQTNKGGFGYRAHRLMYPCKQEVGGFARFELKRTLDSADQLALGKIGQRGELLDELPCLVLRKAGDVSVSDRIVYGANQNERMKANAP